MTGGMESPWEIAQRMRQVIAHVRRIKQVAFYNDREENELKK